MDDFSDMREFDISEMACLSFSGEVTIRARVLTISCFVFWSTYSLFVYKRDVNSAEQMGMDGYEFLGEDVLFAFKGVDVICQSRLLPFQILQIVAELLVDFFAFRDERCFFFPLDAKGC